METIKAKYYDPANHESAPVFLKAADPDSRGYFDFEGYVAGQCYRFKITLDGTPWKHDEIDFEFIVESNDDGTTRVPLRQKLPYQFSEIVHSTKWWIRLLKASGMKDIASL